MLKIEFGTGFLFVGDPPFTRENLLGVIKAEKEVDKSNDVKEEKVADLRKGASCEMCAHGHECRYPDDYKACKMRGSQKWEWRGVKEDGKIG